MSDSRYLSILCESNGFDNAYYQDILDKRAVFDVYEDEMEDPFDEDSDSEKYIQRPYSEPITKKLSSSIEPTDVHSLCPNEENFVRRIELFLQPDFDQIRGLEVFCYHLRILSLIKCGIQEISGLHTLKNLRVLWLSDNNLTVIGNGLNSLSNLKFLYLDNNHLSSFGDMAALPSLRVLDLSYNEFTSLSHLPSFPRLRSLILSCNRLRDVHIQSIPPPILHLSLAGNPLTSFFDLACNRLRDVHIQSIPPPILHLSLAGNPLTSFFDLAYLRVFTRLQSLSLSDPMFGAAPVSHLANYRTFALHHLSTLSVLDGVRVNDREVDDAVRVFSRKMLYYRMKIHALTRTFIACGSAMRMVEEKEKVGLIEALSELRQIIRELNILLGNKKDSFVEKVEEYAMADRLQRAISHGDPGTGTAMSSPLLSSPSMSTTEEELNFSTLLSSAVLDPLLVHSHPSLFPSLATLRALLALCSSLYKSISSTVASLASISAFFQSDNVSFSSSICTSLIAEHSSGGNCRSDTGIAGRSKWLEPIQKLMSSRVSLPPSVKLHIHRVSRVYNRFLRGLYDETNDNTQVSPALVKNGKQGYRKVKYISDDALESAVEAARALEQSEGDSVSVSHQYLFLVCGCSQSERVNGCGGMKTKSRRWKEEFKAEWMKKCGQSPINAISEKDLDSILSSLCTPSDTTSPHSPSSPSQESLLSSYTQIGVPSPSSYARCGICHAIPFTDSLNLIDDDIISRMIRGSNGECAPPSMEERRCCVLVCKVLIRKPKRLQPIRDENGVLHKLPPPLPHHSFPYKPLYGVPPPSSFTHALRKDSNTTVLYEKLLKEKHVWNVEHEDDEAGRKEDDKAHLLDEAAMFFCLDEQCVVPEYVLSYSYEYEDDPQILASGDFKKKSSLVLPSLSSDEDHDVVGHAVGCCASCGVSETDLGSESPDPAVVLGLEGVAGCARWSRRYRKGGERKISAVCESIRQVLKDAGLTVKESKNEERKDAVADGDMCSSLVASTVRDHPLASSYPFLFNTLSSLTSATHTILSSLSLEASFTRGHTLHDTLCASSGIQPRLVRSGTLASCGFTARLKSLSLVGLDMSDAELNGLLAAKRGIKSFLSLFPCLKIFNCSKNRIGTKGLRSVLCEGHPCLEEIICDSNVVDRVCFVLSDEDISLCSDDEKRKRLKQVLSFPQLHTLSLVDNNISNISGELESSLCSSNIDTVFSCVFPALRALYLDLNPIMCVTSEDEEDSNPCVNSKILNIVRNIMTRTNVMRVDHYFSGFFEPSSRSYQAYSRIGSSRAISDQFSKPSLHSLFSGASFPYSLDARDSLALSSSLCISSISLCSYDDDSIEQRAENGMRLIEGKSDDHTHMATFSQSQAKFNLANAVHIDMSHSFISSINSFVSFALPCLTVLNLCNNQISSFPLTSFLRACPILQELDLSRNCIHELTLGGPNPDNSRGGELIRAQSPKNASHIHHKRLWHINLSHNMLKNFENVMKIDSLRALNGSHNQVEHIRHGCLQPNMSELYLSHNQLHTDSVEVLSKYGLSVMELCGNPLTHEIVDSYGSSVSLAEADRMYRLYVIFHMKKIKVLDGKAVSDAEKKQAALTHEGTLSRNQLNDAFTKEVDEKRYETRLVSKQDITLDLSNLSLRDFGALGSDPRSSTITRMDLSRNHMQSLATLPPLPSIRELCLAGNRLVTSGIVNLNSSSKLVLLDLADNCLDRVPSFCFSQLKRLRKLVLAGNPLSKLEASTFASLTHLTHLDLSRCSLRSISGSCLIPLVNLEVMHLDDNGLRGLDSVFPSKSILESHPHFLKRLRLLTASKNRIRDTSSLFRLNILPSLQSLTLAPGNPVCRTGDYNTVILSMLPSLVVLDGKRIEKGGRRRKDYEFTAYK
ncbi:hypothetical protein ADUPG1_007723 [Aduncisulcus paluster]|uniref:Uncharacterized protein n=1 Tax=Aduncisulcus paluster TaxID=2918883 RepID=A0ABQ5KPB7_9EUKA|nr:hypothetical protein ADUPG1_007723 [Aduncisulcus paluster]